MIYFKDLGYQFLNQHSKKQFQYYEQIKGIQVHNEALIIFNKFYQNIEASQKKFVDFSKYVLYVVLYTNNWGKVYKIVFLTKVY